MKPTKVLVKIKIDTVMTINSIFDLSTDKYSTIT